MSIWATRNGGSFLGLSMAGTLHTGEGWGCSAARCNEAHSDGISQHWDVGYAKAHLFSGICWWVRQPNLIHAKCVPGPSPSQQYLHKNRVAFSWGIWASWLPQVPASPVSVADVGLVFPLSFLPFVTWKEGCCEEGAVDAQEGMNDGQLRHKRCGWVPWHTVGMILGDGGEVGWFWQFLSWGVGSLLCSWEQRHLCGFFLCFRPLLCSSFQHCCGALPAASLYTRCLQERESQLLHWHRLCQLPPPRETSTAYVGAWGSHPFLPFPPELPHGGLLGARAAPPKDLFSIW